MKFYLDDFRTISVEGNIPEHLVLYKGERELSFCTDSGRIIVEEDYSFDNPWILYVDNKPQTLLYRFITHQQRYEEMFPFAMDTLGCFYTAVLTSFALYAPTAEGVVLVMEGQRYLMHKERGTFRLTLPGNHELKRYCYEVYRNGETIRVKDPFSYVDTQDDEYSYVLDEKKFYKDFIKPSKKVAKSETILYEMNIRDFSADYRAGFKSPKKFLALTEKGLRKEDCSLGLDYLRELGITHVQFMPILHFAGMDSNNATEYNWGYNPLSYNTIQKTYIDDLENPYAAVNEPAQAIATLHEAGLRVTLDLVFNHVYDPEKFSLSKITPYAYLRYKNDGELANGSYCGNECRSESAFLRAYFVHMSKRLLRTLDIDGIRFDLMGLMDITTVLSINDAMSKLKNDFLVYGEGWNMGDVLPFEQRSVCENAYAVDNISFFDGYFRDTLRGVSYGIEEKGYLLGNLYKGEAALSALQGYCKGPFVNPLQSLNFLECHDNRTFYDRLNLFYPDMDMNEKKEITKLSFAFVLFSQGIPFFHCGQEFMRSKYGVENSYNYPDYYNRVDWNLRISNRDMVEYFKELIAFYKSVPGFHCEQRESVEQNVRVNEENGLLEYCVEGYRVMFNVCFEEREWSFEGDKCIVFNGGKCTETYHQSIILKAHSFIVEKVMN